MSENAERSTYTEDELLPISALQHLQFCERQCALIHLEGVWAENRLTAEGRLMHARVHEAGDESRVDVRIVRGLRLRSLRLGLVGQADVVEFHRQGDVWTPFPVEYKRGRPKPELCDEIQLCAQAICLEEMAGVAVSEGAIFYGLPRRRHSVALSDMLREQTAQTASRLHTLMDAGVTPAAQYEKRCENCSLLNLCMPKVAGRGKSAVQFLNEAIDS